MSKRLRMVSCLIFISLTIQPATVLAQATSTPSGPPSSSLSDEGFRAELILDDKDIFELGSMNQERIQSFLASRGTLGTTKQTDIDGKDKLVSEIVWRVATSYKINPKYLLALLQKEQSLVEDLSPIQKQFDWATGYGVCDSCSKSDPSIQDFKGFASQLEWAAKQHREKYLQQLLMRGKTIAGYAPGKQVTIDGRVVIPENQATAMLYSYTPHIAGNLNLWRIWRRWFGLSFPDGTVAQGRTSKNIYLLRFGQKRIFKSRAAAASLIDPEKIVSVDDSQLTSYVDGKPIAFANYSIVEAEDKRYLIDGQKKRFITNKKVFDKLGFNEDEIIPTTIKDLEDYEDGQDITLATAYPTGLLAKDTKGNHWYIENDVRHAISNTALLKLYFRSRPARTLTTKQLNAFSVGDPYRLHDGELVKTTKSPDIYVIENGIRRPIPEASTFEEMGWKWKNIVALPETLLAQYPIGDAINPHQSSALLSQAPSL